MFFDSKMYRCSVKNCSNRTTENSASDIIYHRLPTNVKINKQWLAVCDSGLPSNAVRICSEHFAGDDYDSVAKIDGSSFKRLKKNSVPHINIPADPEGIVEESADVPKEETGKQLRRHVRAPETESYPGTSIQDTGRMPRKVKGQVYSRRKLYNSHGVHIGTGKDLCDCCEEDCPGCHFPCPKCKSQKCGPVCRTNRRWVYEQNEIEGTDIILKHPSKVTQVIYMDC